MSSVIRRKEICLNVSFRRKNSTDTYQQYVASGTENDSLFSIEFTN